MIDTFRDVLASPAMLPVSDYSSITAMGTFREPHSDDTSLYPKHFSVECERCCVLDVSNGGSCPTSRMKTPFFIFSLAESAAVPADVKAQLYTHAYKVCFRFVAGHQLGGGNARGGGRVCNGFSTLSHPGCLEH